MEKTKTLNKKNSRIYLKRMEYKDALELKNWTDFENELFYGYNYGDFNNDDVRYWYSKINLPRKKYFAVRKIDNDKMIGFLGLKKYNPFLKTAQLGIVFDSAFVSKGYGFEAMNFLLDYYFIDLGFKTLYLDVNKFNTRARNLYSKLGFKEIGETEKVFENQIIHFDDENFVLKNGKIYSKIIEMKITESDR